MIFMLVRLGKFIMIIILVSIIAVFLYCILDNIFGGNTYDGTFVSEEKVGADNGYLY